MFDIQEFLRNLFKYLIEGVGVAVATFLISGQRYGLQEVGLIGLSAGVTLMLLDMYAPGVAAGARQGTGYGLGLQMGNLPVEGFEGHPMYADSAVQEGGEVEVGSEVEPSVHYKKNCNCEAPCANACKSEEGKCDLNCPDSAPCHIEGHGSLAAANCSYKIIDGYYSKAVLPGYNECVKPYNE